MHISEQVAAALKADGWTASSDRVFFKTINNFADAGSLSDGRRVVTLELCTAYRWLMRANPWGGSECEVDLRDFPDMPAEAIATVLA